MSDLNMSHSAQSTSWPIIGAVIGAMSVFALTMGLSYPLLSLIMENMGTPKALIGLNTAMTPMGSIVSSLIIPRLARTRDSWGLAMACLIATLTLFVMIGATRQLEAWFILRFLLGICINGIFVLSETWINQLSPAKTRGRVVGIYVTILALGFCVGPFILPFTGFNGWPPFIVGGICIFTAGLIMLPLRRRIPKFERTEHGSIYRFMILAPTLSMAVLSVAYFDQAVLSLLPLYALNYGFTQDTASFSLGVLIVGNVFLQFPLGWLADRTSRHTIMIMCTATTLVGCALLPVAIRITWLLLPMLFIWGGAAFGVYTMALSGLGDRYSGAMLLTGSAAFGMMWGMGGVVGPASAGAIMQIWGPAVFPLILGIPFMLFFFMLLWRSSNVRVNTD